MLKRIVEIYRHPLSKIFIGMFLLAFIGAVLVSFFESGNNDQFHALNVGYGDKVPVTLGGRAVGVLIMFIGVALLSVFTATISSWFIARQIKERRGLEQIKVKNHILICGWNFHAEQILRTFGMADGFRQTIVLINQLGEEVVSDILAAFDNLKIRFVRGDFTQELIQQRANARNAAAAIIIPDSSAGTGIRSDERTILATLSLKSINPHIKVYAHIVDRENIQHLRKARADEVLLSDAHAGSLLAAHVLTPGIPQAVDQIFGGDGRFTLDRVELAAGLEGKPFAEVRRQTEQNIPVTVLGIGKEQKSVNLSDILSDDYSYLDQFIKRKFEEAGRGIGNESKISIDLNPAPDKTVDERSFLIVLKDRKLKK
jgi:voltage-gated potassium channel